MKILFVNPRFPPSLWDFARCRDLDGSAYAHPPLALPTLAALTPRAHQVALVDENVEPLPLDADVELVGITGYYIQSERVFALADHFRARGVRVAIGGPIVEASTLAECARHADHVFLGEAEYTWPAFLSELAAGAARPLYRQTSFVDMADSPTPRFELLKLERYTTATLESSRGCPYACEFCEIPTRLGRQARSKSVDQVLAEVRALAALGAESIFIVDDHFVGNRGHARRVLAALADFVRSVDYRLYFSCQFTINLARDQALLTEMAAANVRRVFVGIETPRRASLLEVNKKQNTLGDLVADVRAVQAHNITVWAGLVVGFNHDDPAVFDEQLAMMQAAAIPVAMVGLLQAIPGTPLYTRMESAGRLRDDVDMAGVRGTVASLVRSNIAPVGMRADELVRGYQRLVAALYDEERFGDRLLDAVLAGQAPAPAAPHRADGKNLAILARILRWYLWTRDSKRRRLFVRVVGTVLRRRRAELGTALMHLVAYKHLRDFYREVAALPLTTALPAPSPAPARAAPTALPPR